MTQQDIKIISIDFYGIGSEMAESLACCRQVEMFKVSDPSGSLMAARFMEGIGA